MTTAATIAARLTLDKSDYDTGLKTASGQADTFSSKMSGVGKTMMGVGGIMTAGVTVPVVMGFKSIVSSASDLNEASNAMNVVFEDGGASIEKFGETSASVIGMARSDFYQLAAVQGAALKNYGMSNQEAADETMKLGVRAADMASIFNTDVDSAMSAIASLMRGESEPIKRYGVSISEAAVNAKLMAQGLDKLEGQELLAAKAQARLAIFYEQTNQFAGDFANTSDQLANGSRILTAQLKDEAAAFGTQLLPYVLKGIQFFSGLLSKFQSLSPVQQKWIGIILLTVAAIGPLLMIIGSVITALSAIIPVITAVAGVLTFPLIAIIAAVIAIIALLYLAWQNNWGGIREITAEVVQWISDFIGEVMTFISDLTNGQLGEWSAIWSRTMGAIQAIVNIWVQNVKLVWAMFKAFLSGDFTRAGQLFRQIWDNSMKAIKIAVKTGWANIKSFFSGAVASLKVWFAGIDWKVVGTNLIESIAKGLTGALPALLLAGKNVFTALGKFLSGFFSGGSTTISTGGGGIGTIGGGSDNDPSTPWAKGTNGWRTVPSGYPNDTFPMSVTSGERFAVVRRGDSLPGGTVNYFQPQITIVSGQQDPKKAMRGFI